MSVHYSYMLINCMAGKKTPAMVPGPRGPQLQLRSCLARSCLKITKEWTREWTPAPIYPATVRVGDLLRYSQLWYQVLMGNYYDFCCQKVHLPD